MNVERALDRTGSAGATSPVAGPSRISMVFGALGVVGTLALAGCSSGGWGKPPPSQRESPAPGAEGTSPGDHSGQPFGEKG